MSGGDGLAVQSGAQAEADPLADLGGDGVAVAVDLIAGRSPDHESALVVDEVDVEEQVERQLRATASRELQRIVGQACPRVAGVVLTRQRPGKGNAVFITIEDETGVVNALLWSRDLDKQRRAVMAARLMLIEGEIQKSKEGVVHLMAKRVIDRRERATSEV